MSLKMTLNLQIYEMNPGVYRIWLVEPDGIQRCGADVPIARIPDAMEMLGKVLEDEIRKRCL